MYEMRVRSGFSAAHNLKDYRGKCERLHGHNWVVEAVFAYPSLDKSGMAVDFRIAKDALNRAIEKFDHSYLNELKCLKGLNPTSENLAKFIYSSLKKTDKNLKAIIVWENSNCSASYSEG